MPLPEVTMYTDGACKGNPGPGGWGVWLTHGGRDRELFGGENPTTNNRMELLAVIEGLGALKERCTVQLFTDSQYVRQGITSWIHNWKKRGWTTADRKPVKNSDLWKQLDAAQARHEVHWHWVKGHSGDPGNERADALANRGVESVLAGRATASAASSVSSVSVGAPAPAATPAPADDALVRTRDALHAVAEQLLAGPQHRRSGDIRLRVSPGGFRTWTDPWSAVVGTEVLVGGRASALDGRTVRELASELGVDPGAPVDVYPPGATLGLDDVLDVDAAAAGTLAAAWATGDAALRLFAPGSEPVLWPEHFDVAVELDGVDYGVSPGDGFVAEPYAYASVGDLGGTDPFWNAPFGVARPVAELGGVAGVVGLFRDAHGHLPATQGRLA